MKEGTKQTVEAVKHAADAALQNPNLAWAVIPITWIQTWWIEWGSNLMDALTSFLGVIMLLILIRLHLYKTKNIIEENKKLKRENTATLNACKVKSDD